MALSYHGTDRDTGRRLLSLSIERPSDLELSLQLGSNRFICLIAWDATEVSSNDIGAFIGALLDQGAVYFCCWGPGCERVHDIADEEVQVKGVEKHTDSVIMTTWHENEELAEALEFSLQAAEPDEAFASGCAAVLAISVGSVNWAAQTELYLAKYLLKNAI